MLGLRFATPLNPTLSNAGLNETAPEARQHARSAPPSCFFVLGIWQRVEHCVGALALPSYRQGPIRGCASTAAAPPRPDPTHVRGRLPAASCCAADRGLNTQNVRLRGRAIARARRRFPVAARALVGVKYCLIHCVITLYCFEYFFHYCLHCWDFVLIIVSIVLHCVHCILYAPGKLFIFSG